MEQLEAIKKIIQAEEAACKSTVGQLESQIADLEKRGQLIDGQLAELQKSRSELALGVDPAALGLYERIMKSKKDAAIVGIHLGNCQGCHIKLTTQTINNVKASDGIVSCTNCARILYWNPEMGD
jgi:predicted  nucleic acid-binding Zn-ribbon protein